jgi:hypothetical protein
MPTPPLTITAPVVAEVELVASWNIDAPVIPIPPEVTNKAAECEATPAKLEVEPNTEAPLTVNPPVTPNPPAVMLTLDDKVATPETDNVELAVKAPAEVSDVWNVEAPVIPIPPEVTNNEVLNDFTPANVCADVVTNPISPTLAFGMLNVCVEVAEEILNELPPEPTAND